MPADRLQLYSYAGGKCLFCGRSVRGALRRFGTAKNQFEFNHIDPERKDLNYDNLIRRSLSSEQLDEIDKCVLLCRICHGIFHAQDICAKGTISKQIGELKRVQHYVGRGLLNYRTRHLALFSDQPDELAVYFVHLEGRPPQLRLRVDLDKELLPGLVRETQVCGSLLISGADRIPLFRVDRLNAKQYQMQVDVRFPVVQLELHDDPGRPVIWVRNGRAVSVDGHVRRQGIITLHDLPYDDLPTPA